MRRWLFTLVVAFVLPAVPVWAQHGGGGHAGGGGGHVGGSAGGGHAVSGGYVGSAGGYHGSVGYSHTPGYTGSYHPGGAWNGGRWWNGNGWRGYPYRGWGWGYGTRWGYPGWGWGWGYAGWGAYPWWGWYGDAGYYDTYAASTYTAQTYPYYVYVAPTYEGDTAQGSQTQDEINRLNNEVEQLRSQQQAQAANQGKSVEIHSETVLVYRDGHAEEVQNYAIVGKTIWIFSESRARKVPISLLDLTATKRSNEDRGIDFVVPGSH